MKIHFSFFLENIGTETDITTFNFYTTACATFNPNVTTTTYKEAYNNNNYTNNEHMIAGADLHNI